MRIVLLTLTLVVLGPSRAHAEWQLRPFVGLSFGGGTTFFDNEHAIGSANIAFGFNGVWLGELVGVEGDLGHGPGFFQSGDHSTQASILVSSSGVTTLTGNVVVALPRSLTEYTLRPYFVVGTGLMHVRSIDPNDVLSVSRTLPAVDVGGGATGFLTERIGVNWDVRYFHTVGGNAGNFSIGKERLSFWRAVTALVFRY